jgi:hypothetical protein
MARIDRQHGILERERGRTDQQVGERNHDAAALLLGIQLTGKSRNVGGERIDRDRRQELFDECFAPRPPFGGIGTVDTVNEFDDTDRRQGGLLVAGRIDDALKKGWNIGRRGARPQSRHSNRELVPRRRGKRFAVAADHRVKVAAEVAVERRS